MPVVTAKVSQKDIPVEINAIGNVEANKTISVRSQVTGTLSELFINEGDYVNEGAKLFTIDARPYEAALKAAEANLLRDQALLAQAKAQLDRDAASAEYAQATNERNAALVAKGIISKDVAQQTQAAADANTSTVEADKANIESAKAQVDSQEAALDAAKVQLSYCVVTSPIAGRAGNLSLKSGNLLTANTTEVTTIAQIQPVFVTFAVPATYLGDIKRYMAEGALPVAAAPQQGDAKPVYGHLTFVDNNVDATTDTVKLKGAFENADRSLWPGEFARATLRLTTLKDATVVPTEAVQTGQTGQFVFVVKPDFTVEQRNISTGQQNPADTVIQKGLNVGETVVTEGQLRLEPGTRITIADGRDVAPPAGRSGRGGRGGGNGGGGNGQRGQ